jgi:hypothetical protein
LPEAHHWRAEGYPKHYLANRRIPGDCALVVAPRVGMLLEAFKPRLETGMAA